MNTEILEIIEYLAAVYKNILIPPQYNLGEYI